MPRYQVRDELPPSGQGKYERSAYPDHIPMVKALKRKAGKWVMVKECTTTNVASRFANGVRNSKMIAFQDGLYEAKSVRNEVWARYMGDRV